MIGDNATSYPQIGLDLGRGNLTYRFMAGELLSVNGRQRYIVGNRLDYRRGNFWVSVGESALYSGESAVLRLFNPLEFIFVDRSSASDREDISNNTMLNAMFWARVGQGTLYGEFVLDDFDLNPRTGRVDRPIVPTQYHLSFGGRYLGVSDRLEFGFDYRRVSAFSYRPSGDRPSEIWMHLDRGLGTRGRTTTVLRCGRTCIPPFGACVSPPCFSFSARERVTTAFPFRRDSLNLGSSSG